ncbi:class I SAM-dependent rRNA methyltransferase [Marinobacter sp. M3C]|jgi:23S rRNA (cytosine1962-C5)-methyltransferase|uniref:class I SAM-dependent rRNA methyltransferase n=1 Tax=unclassified Marinobacter TaxID=83889 RepID=UPI00200CEDB2|nr:MULTISPECIES: class I SAM-dependent rRNA methyltransferase [unclassified Marinobacter]MCL1481045.1 class I SAM-dependent rRNA methyltransferase [Marinobacter sp.]MCL1483545.1 class I SAM-dependent rRNA methyltransferase [Marinobacter sp.]MCL1488253.1 class I SAM-dependent rRNA methyltransferase [Marinobacter sp.]UQG56817.1 class I SAM-dependent rRNA methyltransferase [Marinobacter sp. M4C]UQG61986.1 class I SAM-dependent rRNA methyltransferase [Marinobacter sp. M3C]
MNFPVLYLRKGAERRLRAGHLWVYSNEVDMKRSPLTGFEAGIQAELRASNDKPLGTVFVNPHALICGRLISRDPTHGMTPQRLTQRMEVALELRQRLFNKPFYRWVFGDSDGLSGLVIDRFGDTVVVQISSAGMEQMKEAIVRAIQRLTQASSIVLKNDGKMRKVEGLESYVEQAHGSAPDMLELEENGVKFEVPLAGGQKTGWFYDHRMNRARLQAYAPGKRVLDVFSYVGGWGIQAASAGATSVTCIDSSASAIESVHHNARLNGLTNVDTIEGDAFDALKALADEKQKFDIVVLDPPALIPRRRDQKAGEQAYARLNQLGLRLLERDGLLVSASCSMHLSQEKLVDIIRGSGRKIDRFVQLLEQGHQAPDHPVIPGIAETDYIKSCFVRSLTGFL